MRPSHSFLFISISYLSPLTISVLAADAANLAVGSRADVVSTILRPGWTSTITALTFFTPSPGADPIPITYQSQPVTSYIPILTICPLIPSTPSLPPLAFNTTFPASASAPSASALHRRQVASSSAPYTNSSAPYTNSSAPYSNTSAPTSYLSSCSISYTPTSTLICHTTLSPLASPAIPITDCTQQVTFSTDHGYTLLPATPNATQTQTQTIIDLTTYYAARWDVLTGGVPTSQAIRKEICSTAPDAGCSTEWKAWSVSTGWVPETSTFTIGDPISVTGPALVILHPALPTWTIPASQTKRISFSTEVPAATSRVVVGISRAATSMGEGVGWMGTMLGGGGKGEGESTTTRTHTKLVTRVVTVQRAGGTGT